jgi:hypothetical protein
VTEQVPRELQIGPDRALVLRRTSRTTAAITIEDSNAEDDDHLELNVDQLEWLRDSLDSMITRIRGTEPVVERFAVVVFIGGQLERAIRCTSAEHARALSEGIGLGANFFDGDDLSRYAIPADLDDLECNEGPNGLAAATAALAELP